MPGDASSPQAESFLVSPPGHHCLALAFLLLPFLCWPSGLFILHSDCPILLVGKLEAVATLEGSCCLWVARGPGQLASLGCYKREPALSTACPLATLFWGDLVSGTVVCPTLWASPGVGWGVQQPSQGRGEKARWYLDRVQRNMSLGLKKGPRALGLLSEGTFGPFLGRRWGHGESCQALCVLGYPVPSHTLISIIPPFPL